MAPPRQPRAQTDDLLHPPNGTNPRHIHAREKDVLHRTLGSTGVSKSKKTVNVTRAPTTTTTAITSSLNPDVRNPANIAQNSIPRPTWKTGPGTSEQRMKWSSMPNATLNRWRTYLALPISAPFSSESARISLEKPDGIGAHLPSMSGTVSRRPRPRGDVERAIAEAFESRPIDEDEVMAGFLARGDEERRTAASRGVIGSAMPMGSGSGSAGEGLFGVGGRMPKPVRCRSDMLS